MNMKKILLGLALLTTLSSLSLSYAGESRKARKAKRKAKTECCVDKSQCHDSQAMKEGASCCKKKSDA